MDYQIFNPIWTSDTQFRVGIRDTVVKRAIRLKEPLLVWFKDGDKVKISHVNKPKMIINEGEVEEMYRKFETPMSIYHITLKINEVQDLERWNMRKFI